MTYLHPVNNWNLWSSEGWHAKVFLMTKGQSMSAHVLEAFQEWLKMATMWLHPFCLSPTAVRGKHGGSFLWPVRALATPRLKLLFYIPKVLCIISNKSLHIGPSKIKGPPKATKLNLSLNMGTIKHGKK